MHNSLEKCTQVELRKTEKKKKNSLLCDYKQNLFKFLRFTLQKYF